MKNTVKKLARMVRQEVSIPFVDVKPSIAIQIVTWEGTPAGAVGTDLGGTGDYAIGSVMGEYVGGREIS